MEICIRLKDDQPLRFLIDELGPDAQVPIFTDRDGDETLVGTTTIKELRHAVKALGGLLINW